MNRATVNKIFQKHPVYVKAGMIAVISIIIFGCVYSKDNGKKLEKDEKGREILRRNESGKDELKSGQRPRANGVYSGVLTEYMYSRSTFKQCLRGRRSLPAFCIIRKQAEQLCMKNGTVILACCLRFAQCGSSNSAKGRHRSGYRRLPH